MKIILGTVRAREGNTHVLVKRNGETVRAVFDGDQAPKLGSDVVGVDNGQKDGVVSMELRKNVTDILMDGNVRIIPATKRPDLTAMLLAKVLERSKTGVIRPGSGMSIERSPHSVDPDLNWAMNAFRDDADQRAIALNVIDMNAVTKAKWEPAALRELSLPADTARNGRTFTQLSDILKSGFHPTCSRTIEQHTGLKQISVNFVLPYSPVAGAAGFARELSLMDRGHYPLTTMSISDSRKLSSARQIARALSHSVLALKTHADVDASPRAKHRSNSFADAAAAMAFVLDGGSRQVIEDFANLLQARIHFGAEGMAAVSEVLEGATHLAVQAACDPKLLNKIKNRSDIVRVAKTIADKTAFPAKAFSADHIPQKLIDDAHDAARRVAIDGYNSDFESRKAIENAFRSETEKLVDEHSVSDLSASRFVMFGRNNAPLGFEHAFDEAVRGLPCVDITSGMTVSQMITNPSTLAERIKKRRPASNEGVFEPDVPIFAS